MIFAAPPGARRGMRDWMELIFKDHGFLRIWWHNHHLVAPGMYRSNQPGPSRIHAAAAAGIRTVINLRGPRSDGAGSWRPKPARLPASPCLILPPAPAPRPTGPCFTPQDICLPRRGFRP